MKDKALRKRIVAEYLTSGQSYREVADRCGVDYRSLHRWVKEYQGRMKKPHKIRRARLLRELPTDKLPTNVETLQSELRKARLYKQALQEAILIAEEELGTPILKKSGTKQSKEWSKERPSKQLECFAACLVTVDRRTTSTSKFGSSKR